MEEIGGIIALKGAWQVIDQPGAVLEGQAVRAGAVLRDAHVEAGDFISVVLLNGKRVEANCALRLDVCANGLAMPSKYIEDSSETRQIIAAAEAVLLDHQPEVARSFSPTISRGQSNAKYTEAVVAWAPAKHLPIGFLLTKLPAYDSSIDAVELLSVQDINKTISTTPIDWPDRERASIALPGPGSYIMQALRDNDEIALNAYVLVLPVDSYNRMQPLFERARQICATWEGSHADVSRDKFLRAYLVSLARRP